MITSASVYICWKCHETHFGCLTLFTSAYVFSEWFLVTNQSRSVHFKEDFEFGQDG